MSYELKQPYTDEQKTDFIVQYNHTQGLVIEESETALYALEAWEKLVDDVVIDNTEEYEAEQAQKEKERIARLNLTGADVERGIYQAKGMDFDDIIALVEHLSKGELDFETGEVINRGTNIDVKALKIELKANHFYRGNPYVNAVGALLGFTSEQLDKFFETNDYTVLLPVEVEDDITTDTID